MKKLLILSSILGFLIANSAFAKTAGNYVGLDLINTNMQMDSYKNGTKVNLKDDDRGNSDQPGVGANYKYAFNFNNAFFAPVLFTEYSNVSLKDNLNDKFNIEYRYGAKLNIGYDFTDTFAAYLNIGAVRNHYSIETYNGNKATDNDNSALYGIGAKFDMTKNLSLNLEYERSMVKTELPAGYSLQEVNFELKILRVGVAYKF